MGYFSFFGCKVFKIGHEKIGLTVTASPILVSMSIYRMLFSSFKVERKIAVVTILFKKIFIGKQYNEGHPKNQILLFSELSVEG